MTIKVPATVTPDNPSLMLSTAAAEDGKSCLRRSNPAGISDEEAVSLIDSPTRAAIDDEWLHQIPDPALNPEQTVLAREGDARLRGLVAALPEALREVLVLREFGELSYTQIASVLEVPVGTVMSRLSRARDNLRVAWLAGE